MNHHLLLTNICLLFQFLIGKFGWNLQICHTKNTCQYAPSGCHGDSVEPTLSHYSLSLPVKRSIIPYLYFIGKYNTKDTIANYY